VRLQPLRRLVISLILLIAAGAAGCASRPPGTVALSFYMRNDSQEDYFYQFRAAGQTEFEGPVVNDPASAGCGWVGRAWSLIVTRGEQAPDPGDPIEVQIGAAELGNRDPVAVSLAIDAAGRVVVDEGVPGWWDSDVQRCP